MRKDQGREYGALEWTRALRGASALTYVAIGVGCLLLGAQVVALVFLLMSATLVLVASRRWNREGSLAEFMWLGTSVTLGYYVLSVLLMDVLPVLQRQLALAY